MAPSEFVKRMMIRPVKIEDWEQWHRLRQSLWPHISLAEEEPEMREYLKGEKMVALIAQTATGQVVGFLEANIRFYADGCDSNNVGYIEGWYVDAAYRQQGIGAALVEVAEAWARSKGCQEMASDCLLENDVSLAAHLALGYEEKERIIQFAKKL